MHAQLLQRRAAFLEAFLLIDYMCHVTTAQSPGSVDLYSVKNAGRVCERHGTIPSLAKYAVMGIPGWI